HDIAVDVGIEVEDVALDRHSIVFEQRRPHADVRDALKRTGEALETGRGHVDAAAWIELVRRIDVDGRKSDLPAQASSGNNATVDEIRPPEGQGDGAHGAFVDGVAHIRARGADASNAHLVDAFHFETQTR